MTDDAFYLHRMRRLSAQDSEARALAFRDELAERRSVRTFSAEPVPRRWIELAIETASSAPSGAHRQPWKFVAVSDPAHKRAIRVAAEEEERESYEHRMPSEWKEALAPLGTDWHKPYLEIVPWIVVVFAEAYGVRPDGSRSKNYYVSESVGIACGFFIAALHHMGLATLTHTPNPMNFLSDILRRPPNEKPYILFPIGYPAADARVPNLRRKGLDEVAVFDPGPPRPGPAAPC